MWVLIQLAEASGAFTSFIVGRKRRWGWCCSMLAQFAWATWAVLSHTWGFLPWCAIYFGIAARNWVEWGNRG